MRKFLMILMTMGLMTSVVAQADEFNSDTLVEATKVALADFNKTFGEHAQHLTGFKAWKTSGNAKVKIYYAHGTMNMEADYLCENQSNTILCAEQ